MNDALQARCSKHHEAGVSFTCPRCGSFGCVECERRRTLDATPLCPSCWPVSGPAGPDGALQTAGLVVALVSLVPCWPVALASVALNVIALVKATKANRRKALVGLGVSLLAVALQVLFYVLYARYMISSIRR